MRNEQYLPHVIPPVASPNSSGRDDGSWLITDDGQLTIQLYVRPEVPDAGSPVQAAQSVVVVNIERGRSVSLLPAQITARNGSRGIAEQVDIFTDHDPLFDAITAEELKWLRVFHEIGVEFFKGAKSLRQAGKRFDDRKLKSAYLSDLPSGEVAASRCHREVKSFFGKRLGLGDEQLLLVSAGNGKALFALTDFGRELWKSTSRYLIKRGFIPESR